MAKQYQRQSGRLLLQEFSHRVAIQNQFVPTLLRCEETNLIALRTVSTMVMRADHVATLCSFSGEAVITCDVLAQTVKYLDDRSRRHRWLPNVNWNLVTVVAAYRVATDHGDSSYTVAMIELYYWPTPNGHKISIMLEECGLDYDVKPVNIGAGDQFDPEFLAISPNNRMPAIVDKDTGISVFEGGAILIYLAEKSEKLLPKETGPRFEVLQWLFWQAGGLGPMAGQLSHFVNYVDEDIPYALERYANEYDRLLAVMDVRLRDREFIAGDYSIADIASFPWVLPYRRLGNDLDKFTNLRRWFDTLKVRPAVQAGVDLGKNWARDEARSEKARALMFDQNAETVFKAAQALEE